MKIHSLTRQQLQYLELNPSDCLGLCVYEAEAKDSWTGFFAAHEGWSGKLPTPVEPMQTYGLAVDNWLKCFKQLQSGLASQGTRTSFPAWSVDHIIAMPSTGVTD